MEPETLAGGHKRPDDALRLDHLVILVTDLAASLPFYERLLGLIGFRKTGQSVFGNPDGVYIDLKQASEPEHGYHRHGQGLNHMGFTAPSLAALERVRAGMREAGFDVPEVQVLGDDHAVFFRDPDGMRLEVTVYGPVR